jgi:hypothetical protein
MIITGICAGRGDIHRQRQHDQPAETGTQVDTVPVADGPAGLIGYYQYG